MRVCYNVPGLLGSELRLNAPGESLVWVNVTRLAFNGFALLRLAPNGVDPSPDGGADLKAGAPLSSYYRSLTNKLASGLAPHGYTVIPWGYDWRKKIRDQGAFLASSIRETSSVADPCSIVAHSQGGLIARAAWYDLLGTNEEAKVRRIITVGTPHQGSYSPAGVFSLEDEMIDQISLVTGLLAGVTLAGGYIAGVRHWNALDICQLCATWPAFYELMPMLGGSEASTDPNRGLLFDVSNWPSGRGIDGGWLAYARDSFQAWLRSTSSMPPPWVLTTVAGTGYPTIGRLQWPRDLGSASAFGLARDGDGRTAEGSALLPGSSRYLMVGGHSAQPSLLARDDDIIAWVLEERSPPSPPPPVARFAGLGVPAFGGPPVAWNVPPSDDP